jgi:DNA invertase Pin-like site-specific DNA recombinase
MPTQTLTPLRLIGLTRKSRGEDEGTHADQRRIVEARIASDPSLSLLRIEQEHKVSGAKDWRSREIGRALADIEAGQADGVIVAYQDRITRERLAQAAEIWEALEAAGAVFISCDGTDSRAPGSELLFAIKAAIARDQWKTYQRRSNDGRARSVANGIHGGGDAAPLGYSWTERADGTKSASGKPKHGPLVPNEHAPLVLAAFKAKDEGASWKTITLLLGAGSASNAAWILRRRTYLGEAFSGSYRQANAHTAIVPEDLFNRVQRKLDAAPKRTREAQSPAPLARVVICSACGHSLTFDKHMKVPGYRCKNLLCVGPRPTVTDAKILDAVMDEAKWLHREHYKLVSLNAQMDDAILPGLEQALKEAAEEIAEVEAMRESVRLSVWGQMMETAERKREDLARQIGEVEASKGWHGLSPAKLDGKLALGDAETRNDFLRAMVEVVVFPVGRGRHNVPAKDRLFFIYRGIDGSYSGPDLRAAALALNERTEVLGVGVVLCEPV